MAATLAVLGSLAAATGCGRPTEPAGDIAVQHTASPGDTVRLAFGEAVEVTATGVDIRFAAVEADSRCPIDVVCVWEGDAHVRIDLFSAGRRQSAGLHTSLEPKAVRYEGLTIRLVAVAPARTSTDTLRQQDYSIRLLIEQN